MTSTSCGALNLQRAEMPAQVLREWGPLGPHGGFGVWHAGCNVLGQGAHMLTNLSPLDRGLRAGLGFFLFASPALELHTYPYNFLGLLLVATSIVGFCPIYALFRVRAPSTPTVSLPRA
jgi:hypothetical protein